MNSLDMFHNYLNTTQKNIKFDKPQCNPDTNSCTFLDITVTIKDQKIHTGVYRKPTDTPSALLLSSSHPKHVTNNIIYTLAFRLLRICSEPEVLMFRQQELKHTYLKPRNYKSSHIDEVFEKILKIPRQTALEKTKKDKDAAEDINNVLTVPITHDPRVPN